MGNPLICYPSLPPTAIVYSEVQPCPVSTAFLWYRFIVTYTDQLTAWFVFHVSCTGHIKPDYGTFLPQIMVFTMYWFLLQCDKEIMSTSQVAQCGGCDFFKNGSVLTRNLLCEASSCMGRLQLSGISISALDPLVFRGLTGLTEMWVAHMNPPVLFFFFIPHDLGLVYVQEFLMIKDRVCILWILSCNLFCRLLNNNSLTTLPGDVFQGLSSLNILWEVPHSTLI